MGALVLIGIALFGGGLAVWLTGGNSNPSTTSTTASTSVASTPSGTSTTGGTTSPGTTTQTQSTSLGQLVTTDPGDPSDRSDTLTIALLGFGAGLALLGMFLPRITTITFGGVTVGLSPTTVGKAVGLTLQAAPQLSQDTEAVRGLVLDTLSALTPDEVEPAEVFSEQFVSDAVAAAQEEGARD